MSSHLVIPSQWEPHWDSAGMALVRSDTFIYFILFFQEHGRAHLFKNESQGSIDERLAKSFCKGTENKLNFGDHAFSVTKSQLCPQIQAILPLK